MKSPASSRLRKPQIPRSKMKTTDKDAASPSQSTASTSEETYPPPIYAWKMLGSDTVTQSPDTDIIPGRTHTYTFDKVYGPESSTKVLYNDSVQSLVHAAMNGYHASVLAYGQTSTGKTHTMSGSNNSPGLIPLCIQECFDYLQQMGEGREYMFRFSYLEVYKEHIQDLLASGTQTPIRLFDSVDGLVIRGLVEQVVASPDEVFELLKQGEARRRVGATHLNQHSSRSHSMVRLWIESTDTSGTARVSSLSLVDLAGSESVRLTGNSERKQEGHYINKSLMTLGQVVHALSDMADSGDEVSTTKHVPYRDSKLTRLLQPSLSGNAQVVMICCISPLPSHVEESHNTFKFATRAKKIPQKAERQETLDEKTLLQSYRDEIEDLRKQLQEAKEQQELLMQQKVEASPPDEDVAQLVEAIKTMERLILKSTSSPTRSVLPTSGDDDDLLLDLSERGDNHDDSDLLALATPNGYKTPMKADTMNEHEVFSAELTRIRGLLGSVLHSRRKGGSQSSDQAGAGEVEELRRQLEKQEVVTSMRQADSSFLLKQLEEKDVLLREVSKILEAVEERQSQLEAENLFLRKKLESRLVEL